jgi:transcriptional regulator with XRE-family HTH domain
MTPDERSRQLVEFLIDRREELGLTQHELAERVDWSQGRVSAFERAEYPSIKTTVRYARAVGIELVPVERELCPKL